MKNSVKFKGLHMYSAFNLHVYIFKHNGILLDIFVHVIGEGKEDFSLLECSNAEFLLKT